MLNFRAVPARKSAVPGALNPALEIGGGFVEALSAMAATLMLKPVANISGSTTSEPAGTLASAISVCTLAKLAALFSQAISIWQQKIFISFAIFSSNQAPAGQCPRRQFLFPKHRRRCAGNSRAEDHSNRWRLARLPRCPSQKRCLG